MRKSSSSYSHSDSDQDQSPQISITQEWFHGKIKTPKDLILCPICYQYVYQPVQCESCGRLFCKQDYYSTKKIKNSCPLCKASPWSKKESIHIAYKLILDQVMFRCQICKKKNISHSELKQHLQKQHKKILKLHEDKLIDYTLVYNDGKVQQLNFYQNLGINYNRKIIKSMKDDVSILCDEQDLICIDFSSDSFITNQANTGKVISKQSKMLTYNKQYIAWIFSGHKSEHQLYTQQNQLKIQKQYEKFIQNDKLCQMHIDTKLGSDNDILRYRLMFGTMKQVNVSTGFKRDLVRQIICFKEE